MRFLICNYPYNEKAAGIRVLFYLAEVLQNLEYSVYIVNIGSDGSNINECDYMKSKNLEYFRGEVTPEDIVIYPELIRENPLNAQNVVRYFLNRPMYIDRTVINYGDDDLLIAFSKKIDPNLDELFILLDDRHLFYPPDDWDEKENIACIYFGKGKRQIVDPELITFLDQFDQVIQITRDFPANREDYAELLRRSKVLICCDSLTAVSAESLLCGTPVYLVDDFFKICKSNLEMTNYGTFDSLELYEKAIEEVPFFQLEFELAIQKGNIERIKNFGALSIKYFETINKFKQEYPDIYQQFLNHKRSRQELDNYRYLKYINSNNSICI